MAEDVGFEPTKPFGLTVFKTAAFGRSANLPIKHHNTCNAIQIWWRVQESNLPIVDYAPTVSPLQYPAIEVGFNL